MDKINIDDFIKILDEDVVKNNSCIEMNFYVEGDKDYTDRWLGKMPNKSSLTEEAYWYGLVDNGSQDYDYDNQKDFLEAKVFNGKSIYEIFEKIHWHSLDGCSLEERLGYYLND